jgi:hypothetical protein
VMANSLWLTLGDGYIYIYIYIYTYIYIYIYIYVYIKEKNDMEDRRTPSFNCSLV